MCKTEAIVYRCGCTIGQPIKRCRQARDAFADNQRKRIFEWSSKKRKRQSVFAEHYTKEGYCRQLDRVLFPSSSLCPVHEGRYDGAQSFPRTNPLLRPNRDDGLVFVETNAYDGSGKMLPRQCVSSAPQPAYHPQSTSHSYAAPNTRAPPPMAITHPSSSSDRFSSSSSSWSRTRTNKDSQSRRDREDETRTEKILKEAEKLSRDRGKKPSKSRGHSKSAEDIRRRAIARSREQLQSREQAPPPVSAVPSPYEEARPEQHPFRASLVPAPLNLATKTQQRLQVRTPTTATGRYTYPTTSSTRYYDDHLPASSEHPRRTVAGTSYPPAAAPRGHTAVTSTSSSRSRSRTRAAAPPEDHPLAEAVTWYGAATHPRAARGTREYARSGGGSSSSSGSHLDSSRRGRTALLLLLF